MTDTYRTRLVHTLRRVLRPLVQILFRAGVRFDEFVELLRGIYTEISIRDALGSGHKISVGKISILSGVARRDVSRLVRSDDWLKVPAPTDAGALAAVLHRWHTEPTYLGPYGVPLELPLSGSGSRTFVDLVEGSPISIEVTRAYEQLLAARMIVRSGNTHVKVLSRTYMMPEPLSPAMLEHFGTAMTNLASTLNFNMTPDQNEKRLEKTVFPDDGLPQELLAEFDHFIRERTSQLISDVDDWLAAAVRRPIEKSAPPVATGLNVFHYVSKAEPQFSLEDQVAREI